MTNPTLKQKVFITDEQQQEIYEISQINKKGDKVKLTWFGEPLIQPEYCDKNGWYPISILSIAKEYNPHKALNHFNSFSEQILAKADVINDNELSEAFKKIRENLSILLHKPMFNQPMLDLQFRKEALFNICKIIIDNADTFMSEKLPFIYYPCLRVAENTHFFIRDVTSLVKNKYKYGIWIKDVNIYNMCDYLGEYNIKMLNAFINKSIKYSPHADIEECISKVEKAKKAFITFEEWLLDNYYLKGATLRELGLDNTKGHSSEYVALITSNIEEYQELYNKYRECRREGFLELGDVMDKMWW